MPSRLELALAYTKAGISIIPISPGGTPGPNGSKDTPFDCSEFVSRRIATPDELHEWFTDGSQLGLAAVLGQVSGGLECLDLIYTAVVKLFRQLVTLEGGESLLEKLPAVQENANGRTRLYYRCSNPVSGDRPLAQFQLPSEPEVVRLQLLAFVHGEGSWTVLPGSPTTRSNSNQGYQWVAHDLTAVPTITPDERQLLLESASCLNTWVDPAAVSAPSSPHGFDMSVTWEKILLPLGWRKLREFGEVAVWRSPGRTREGYCAVSGIGLNNDLLYVIQSGRAYTRFGAFSWLHFDGNLERARCVSPPPAPPSRWETAAGKRYLRALKKTIPPLVSCITPTTGERRRFLPQAIKCFQRQTYANLELVILCDGEDDMSDLIPYDDGRVHYFYLGRDRHTLGAKWNLACERSHGELIAHLDDDDWSHPDRLSFQVGALLAEGAEICGISQLLFLELGTGEVWLNRAPALLHPSLYPGLNFGGTYLYRRSYWSNAPFPDVSQDANIPFTSANGRQDHSVLVSDHRLYVAMIHGSNTSDSTEKSPYWSSWPGDIREVMGKDLDFYLALRQS